MKNRNKSSFFLFRVAFVKFAAPEAVDICLHLNNTVFIDRAIIITPVQSGEVPDETCGLQLAQSNGGANGAAAAHAHKGEACVDL